MLSEDVFSISRFSGAEDNNLLPLHPWFKQTPGHLKAKCYLWAKPQFPGEEKLAEKKAHLGRPSWMSVYCSCFRVGGEPAVTPTVDKGLSRYTKIYSDGEHWDSLALGQPNTHLVHVGQEWPHTLSSIYQTILFHVLFQPLIN